MLQEERQDEQDGEVYVKVATKYWVDLIKRLSLPPKKSSSNLEKKFKLLEKEIFKGIKEELEKKKKETGCPVCYMLLMKDYADSILLKALSKSNITVDLSSVEIEFMSICEQVVTVYSSREHKVLWVQKE